MARRSIALRFPGSRAAELTARMELPGTEPSAFALFAPCYTCTKDVIPVARISRGLAERGIAVMRFDFTGLGGSGGDFADTTFSSNVDDVVTAAAFLAERDTAPALLIGHSLGGTAVLAAAARIPSATAVCTINAPFDPDHVRHHFGHAEGAIRAAGEAKVAIAGRPFTVRREFLDDLGRHDLATAITTLGRALLVLHATEDETVPVEHGHRIFAAAAEPKMFVALDGGNHLLTRRTDTDAAAEAIAKWAAQHAANLRSNRA